MTTTLTFCTSFPYYRLPNSKVFSKICYKTLGKCFIVRAVIKFWSSCRKEDSPVTSSELIRNRCYRLWPLMTAHVLLSYGCTWETSWEDCYKLTRTRGTVYWCHQCAQWEYVAHSCYWIWLGEYSSYVIMK